MKEIILLLYLAVLALFDWREQKVPVVLLTAGGIIALSYNLYGLLRISENREWFLLSFLLGLLPGIFMLVMARLTDKAGYGDGMAILNVGMFTNYKTCILLLCFSVLFISVFSAGMLLMKKADKNTRLPYLPFLAAVYAARVLW